MSTITTTNESALNLAEVLGAMVLVGPHQARLAVLAIGPAPAWAGDKHGTEHGRVGSSTYTAAAIADHLARSADLLPEEWQFLFEPIDAIAIAYPGTTCCRCRTAPARYETWAIKFGVAEFLCDTCAAPLDGHVLGSGSVTALVDVGDVPVEYLHLANAVCRELGRPDHFAIPTTPRNVQ